MKKILFYISVLLVSISVSSSAADSIMVQDAWVRSAPPNAKALAAYMKIINTSAEQRALISASSSRFGRVEMHKSEMHEGIMKMIPQKQLTVPAGGSLLLKPMSYHLMLMKPVSVPREGDLVDFDLRFDDGTVLHLRVPVRAAKSGRMMKSHD